MCESSESCYHLNSRLKNVLDLFFSECSEPWQYCCSNSLVKFRFAMVRIKKKLFGMPSPRYNKSIVMESAFGIFLVRHSKQIWSVFESRFTRYSWLEGKATKHDQNKRSRRVNKMLHCSVTQQPTRFER